MSYSQLGQDLKVLEFYNNKLDGFFIEIGASDGINLSNTYLLEKNHNWKGICVEPIPNNLLSTASTVNLLSRSSANTSSSASFIRRRGARRSNGISL